MIRGSLADRSPWVQVLVLFLLAMGSSILFTTLGTFLASAIYPISVEEILSSLAMPGPGNIKVVKLVQGFNTIGTFMLPGLLGAYLFSFPETDMLGVNRLPRYAIAVFSVVVIMTLAGTTVSDGLYRFTKNMELSFLPDAFTESLEASEVSMMQHIEAFLQMASFMDFVEVFLVLAVLPAICEETLFRGALQPVLHRAFRSGHLAVWVTAFLFALLHMQFYTFLSIFALGVVLGYLRLWSKSLWPSILMHLVNNGTIVVAVYFWNISFSEANELAGDWQWEYMLPLLLVFFGCLYGIYRLLKK